jgi:polysaccharide pyruvyl transferase WcaK-like protein
MRHFDMAILKSMPPSTAAEYVDPRPARPLGMTGHALILNYTAIDYHFGCFATSVALYNALADDGYAVSTRSVRLTQMLALPVATPSDLDCPDLYGAFRERHGELDHAIASATMVVINGEGTLHGARPATHSLLYLMALAKRRHGRPTYLVNHSLFPGGKAAMCNPGQLDLYRAAIDPLDGVAARESLSHAIHGQMGIAAIQSFDMLPLFADRAGHSAPPSPPERPMVVIGVGVGFSQAQAAALAMTVRAATAGRDVRLVFLDGAPRGNPREENEARAVFAQIDPGIEVAQPLLDANASDGARALDWLGLIARASLVVTGRYHHVVAALALGTPVVALSSNTPKIEGSFDLLGIRHKVIEPREDGWTETLAKAVAAGLEGDAATSTAQQRRHMMDLAERNAVWRGPAAATDTEAKAGP